MCFMCPESGQSSAALFAHGQMIRVGHVSRILCMSDLFTREFVDSTRLSRWKIILQTLLQAVFEHDLVTGQ